MLKSGSVLDGRYKILELLGEGGNGSVWKAEELQLCRLVAIKILHALSVADHPSRRRFKREGKALATLSHKNLIGFYCFGVTEAQYSYIVMEYMEGKSVRQLLQQEKPGIERCLAIIMQACDGLYEAHNHNVIHRDLSPNNIMLVNAESGEDQVKIIDFGLSRMLDSGATNDQKLTKSGTIMGSIYYISPEHCAGREADAKSDIYSLGCVLYEMITGRTVFEAENPVGLMRKHLEEKPARLDSLLDSDLIPPGLEIALQKALAKKPEERYQSMKDFRDDLSLILQGKGASISASIPLASEEQEAARKPSLGKVSLVLLGVAVTVASGFGIWKLTARQPAAQIHEDLNSEQTVLRRLRTPAELARCTKQERVAYLGNWLREYESSDSQDAAAAHVRLAEELKDTDQVEYRLQLEGALQQYKKALEKTLKKGKGGSEATTLIGNVLNCRNLAKQLNMVPSDLIEIMDMIEGISKTELALPFLACRRELAQHYINQRQYSTALKVLDETENGKYADSMGTDATIHLYLSRAKCYRLLNRPADALKSLEGAIELSSKIKAPGSLEISVALLNEGLAQNLSPIKRLSLSLATIQAVQSTEKSHESAGPAFADAVTILIEQKQFKRALEVALNGLNWSSAPLDRLKLWRLIATIDHEAKLEQCQKVADLMYAELKKLPDKNPPNVIGIFLQSVARYVSIAEIKNDDKAKMKFVECAKLALSKCDGDPPQVVIHPIIQISNYFLQMGSPEPSEDLITYTLKYLKTARAPNFPIQGALTQHLLAISRRKSPEEHRKYCSKLLDETSRPEIVNGSTDAAIAHMHLMRSRILRELNKPDEAYASAQLAADHARKSGNPLQEGEAYVELATAELYKKNYAEAEKLVDAAAAVFPKERADWRFRCYGQKADCLLALHRDNEYRSLLKQSVQDLSREHPALVPPLRVTYLTSCIRNNRKELQRETESLFASLSSTNLKNEPVGITH